jgi:hypothetical protein
MAGASSRMLITRAPGNRLAVPPNVDAFRLRSQVVSVDGAAQDGMDGGSGQAELVGDRDRVQSRFTA